MTGLEMKLVFVLVLAVMVAAPIRCTTDHDVTQMMHRLQRLEAENHQLLRKLEHSDKLHINLEAKLENLQGKVDNLKPIDVIETLKDDQTTIQDSYIPSSVYMRWGRTSCGPGNELVYAGVMGKSHFSISGGGVNQQCLPLDPQYASVVEGEQYSTPGRALMYGAEYQGDPDTVFDEFNLPIGETTFVDQDIPCAVCRVENRTAVLMIPAQSECPVDWNRQYTGYLMAEHYSEDAVSEFICVDRAPEVVDGGSADTSSSHMYLVEVICGESLPCPNYVHGWELTCVVCTR